jgi:hypothetical protein
MSLTVILSIIFIHWVADFVFQAEEWATNKSKSIVPLTMHTFTYTLVWMIPAGFLFSSPCDLSPVFGRCVDGYKMLTFLGITFVAHTITDYFTSRIVSRKFANKEYGSPIPNFGAFTVIGFDQVLHYVQLFATYYYLSK